MKKRIKVFSISVLATLLLGVVACNTTSTESTVTTKVPTTTVSQPTSTDISTTVIPTTTVSQPTTSLPTTTGGNTSGGGTTTPDKKTYNVTVKVLEEEKIIKVEEGNRIEELERPTLTDGIFLGWYLENEENPYDFTSPVTQDITIVANIATFEEQKLEGVKGYKEGLYTVLKETNASSVEAFVRTSDNETIKVDKELIRQISATETRIDVLGLKTGYYNLIVKNSQGKYYLSSDVLVEEDDRSGYAHFGNSTGVGAYNNDGTLKDGAIVVYVSEANKNTVEAIVNGQKCVGLVQIIQAATNANEALDVRIIGNITTTQWNKISYGKGNTQARQSAIESAFDYDKNMDYFNNEISSSSSRIYEKEIKALGINSMSDDESKGIVELNGLTNFVSRKKSSSTVSWSSNAIHEYDSYYNMLDVMGGANITIEGIGTDASFTQFGLTFKQSNSIEVKNIRFEKYTEDAIGFEGKSNTEIDFGNYWVHNCQFDVGLNNWDVCPENDKDDGDGSTDLKRCHNVTISYSFYNGCHKTNLIGSGDTIKQYNITLHHNYYYKCSQRLPLIRQANIHMYNNYYYGSTGYSNSIRANCFAFVENCYYEGGKNPYEIKSSAVMKSYNNIYDGVSISSSSYKKGNTAEYREQEFASNCKPDGTDKSYANFDTNKELFYYDEVNNRSDVSYLTDAQTAKFDCIAYAGCLKNTEKEFVKVNYELNGGSLGTSINYTKAIKGQIINLPSPEKEDGIFVGWYTDSELTQVFNSEATIENEITLYAKYSEAVTVVYDTNGGSLAQTKDVVAKGSLINPSTPSLKGMSFVGWYKDPELTQAFDPANPISENITLYAKWKEQKAVLYDFSTIAKNTYTQDFTKEEYGYVVKCTTEKPISISKFSSNLEFDGYSFPRGINTGGAGNENYRSIEFTITEPKKIVVYSYSASNGTARSACIYGIAQKYNLATSQFEDGYVKLAVGPASTGSSNPVKFEYYINPGTYYIASNNGGIILLGYTLETIDEVQINSSTVAFIDDTKIYGQYIVENGTTISALDAPSRPGHTFIGWYCNGEPFSFETKIEQNTIIEAKYEVLEIINVEFDTTNAIKQFDLGSDFSANGLSAKVIYSDGSSEEIDISLCTIDSSLYNKDNVGEYTINVSYLGFSDSYTVNVVNHVTSISVSDVFLQTIVVGDGVYNTDDIVVLANTTTGVEACTSECTITTTEADNVITVSVVYNNLEEISTSFNVYRLKAIDEANPNIVVDPNYEGLPGAIIDGKYSFNNISQAVDYVALSNVTVTTTINLKQGVYEEKLCITHPNIHLVGEGYNNTIIKYGTASGTTKPDQSGTWGTSGSASVLVSESAVGFYAEGISFENSFDYISSSLDGKQAVALYVQADQAVFNKCRFFGYQDTLETKSGRQLFYDCLVEGAVDFIFGYNSTTVFANCEIRSIYRGQQGGYIAAFQGCNGEAGVNTVKYGCIFANCSVTAGANVNDSTISLARPWRQDSNVAYIGCNMDSHIRTNGSESSGRYVSMSGNTAANARFYEYKNTGAGAISEAVTGVKMLTQTEAEAYTIANIFSHDQDGVQYESDWDGSVALITTTGKTTTKLWNGVDLTSTPITEGYTAKLNYSELFEKYNVDNGTNNLAEDITEGKFTLSKGVAIKSNCISNNKRESIYDDTDPSKNQAVIIFEVEEEYTGKISIIMSSNEATRVVSLYKVENGELALVKSSYKTFSADLSSGKYVIGFSNGYEPKITEITLVCK